jgi:cellulose synthase/poly-beta-1,6-N-acetylglucosamine synthase-like glycosyltransferase
MPTTIQGVTQREPFVTLVTVAYNESSHIRQRLENFLDLDYPWDRIEIIVVSDGSTDDTAAIAREYLSPFVHVITFITRRGKSAVLNDVIPRARGQIVVLADVRQRLETNALHALTDHFTDPKVGAVGGELILLNHANLSEVGQGIDFYWRYEKFIRSQESNVDSTVGVTGAIYALRRELFKPIRESTILDDVLIPMQIARQGYRVLFEPRARAYDWASATARTEFVRKLRTIGGNFQLFFTVFWLLNPFSNRLWIQTVSHKTCRLLSPLCLLSVFLSNLLLSGHPIYLVLFVAQSLFYITALIGYLMRGSRKKLYLLNIPYAFCLLNWATVMALVRYINGRQRVTWEKTIG